MSFETRIDLRSLNTLGLPSRCADVRLLSEPADLVRFLQNAGPSERRQTQIAGELSNTVLGSSLEDPLVIFKGGKIIDIGRRAGAVLVRAAASCRFDSVVETLCDLGVPGLELLSGIPGTVGAAVAQNVAAYGQRLSDRFLSARALDLETGAVGDLDIAALEFSYRSSALKTAARYTPRQVLLEVLLQLPQEAPVAALHYEDLRRLHSLLSRDEADLVARRQTVLQVRETKGMVVGGRNWVPSAGSFFLSPIVPAEMALQIARRVRGSAFAENFFSWYQPDARHTRVPAALVIRACGFVNGDRWGPVGLSPHHVLAFCAYDGATALDVAALSSFVQHRVHEQLGLTLDREVRFLAVPDAIGLERHLDQYAFQAGCGEPQWALDLGAPSAGTRRPDARSSLISSMLGRWRRGSVGDHR